MIVYDYILISRYYANPNNIQIDLVDRHCIHRQMDSLLERHYFLVVSMRKIAYFRLCIPRTAASPPLSDLLLVQALV